MSKPAWEVEMEKRIQEAKKKSKSSVTDDSSFIISVDGVKGNSGVLKKTFKPSDDVKELREAVAKEITDNDNIAMRYHGRTLDDGKTLRSYGITGPECINLTFRTVGGSAMPSEPTYKYPHVFDPKRYPSLRTTTEPDAIFYIDNEDNPRVAAPCGHGFIAETYYLLMKSVLKDDFVSYRLYCPMPGCGKEIPFSFVAKAACMTDEERIYFSMHIGRRSLKKITKNCPTCERACDPPVERRYSRVNCVSCKGGDFCFQCGQLWKGGGFQICGNKLCTSYGLQIAIDTCDEIDLAAGSRTFKCYKLRACPNCLSIIEWKSACKHFTCKSCTHKFCFLCLKSQTDCKESSHTVFCEIAPRQKLK